VFVLICGSTAWPRPAGISGKLSPGAGVRERVPTLRSPSPRLRAWLCGLSVLLIGLGFAACGGERPHRPRPGDEGDAAVAMTRMEAKGMFFGGQVEVEALLARAGTHWSREDGGNGGSTSGRSGRGGGGGGFHGGMGMGGMRGGYGGGRGGRGREGGGMEEDGGSEGGARPPPMRVSNQAPIVFRLRLTNHGAAPVDIEVVDFDSVLGNFVVQPEKITVKPGESVEAEPMVSRLGAPSAEVPLTVNLQAGGHAEKQVLTLRAVKEAPPPVDAPAPASS
jgi:hypothetical protein